MAEKNIVVLLILAALFVVGCSTDTTESTSTVDGVIDCENSPIQSTSEAVFPAKPEDCLKLGRSSHQPVASSASYVRRFITPKEFIVVYYVKAGHRTYLEYRDTEELLHGFAEVSASGRDWGPVTKTSIEGESYEFQRFSILEKSTCIGYSSYLEGQWGSAGELLVGFMCAKTNEIHEDDLSFFLGKLVIK
jgi:hypothetical protein